jgi:glycosyltransferase XagB
MQPRRPSRLASSPRPDELTAPSAARPSARDGSSPAQKALVAAIASLVLGLGFVAWDPIAPLAILLAPLCIIQTLISLGAALERPAPVAEPPRLDEPPTYTILAPLHDEARVAADLVQALNDLDYPRDRLEVFFLLEADDRSTQTALNELTLPEGFRIVIVPPGGPRTKPQALNHGLTLARGEFITVYDAEDIPDPRQLLRAAAAFSAAPDTVACLQARLVIDNADDGWLARMMAIEYASLFDATKCGLAAMRLPVALGGSSNHFRTDALRKLGGWDAWNVTEDADLGLQLARLGLAVGDLPSDTYEEAPFELSNWFLQRRRWMKGFLQTLIAHSRRPTASIRLIGWLGWLAGMTQVGGALLGALFFPLFALHIGWHAATGGLFMAGSPLAAASNTLALWVAACGCMTALAPALIGLARRRRMSLAPWLATLPLYVLLISAAAWAALVEQARAPHHWDKTSHGKSAARGG